MADAEKIADKFNEHFTEIGTSRASEIETSNKAPLTHMYVVISFSVNEYAATIRYSKLKFGHMHLCGMDCKCFSPQLQV